MHDDRASFDKLRMREDFRGTKKDLILSLSKDAGRYAILDHLRVSAPPRERVGHCDMTTSAGDD